MTDNRTWEPLLEELTVKTFYTPNNPSEFYTLYLKSDLEEEALNKLTRSIRIIDRLFLYTLPVIVILVEPRGHHQLGHAMGWGIHKPKIEDSAEILTKGLSRIWQSIAWLPRFLTGILKMDRLISLNLANFRKNII